MRNPLDNIRIVLVSPLYGGNIGAVCRAMANNGLHQLAVAEPRDQLIDAGLIRSRACRAVNIYEQRRSFATLAEAVADCSLVAGTTARMGLYRSHARSPRDWTPHLLRGAAAGRVALVFGPEDSGLENNHLSLCTQIIQIPSSPDYPSLNLAQAVMVCCYELFLESGRFAQAAEEASPEAPSELRERMFDLWRDVLLEIGFMKEDKADHMMMGLRRILSRGSLSVNDVKIMMGIARQVRWAARRSDCS